MPGASGVTGGAVSRAGLVLAAICALTSAALARDVHVAPGADEAQADGSVEAPFPTVHKALRSGVVTGGDRVVLRDGAYGQIKIAKADYDPPVEIVAQTPGQVHAEQLLVRDSHGLRFHDLSVWPLRPATKPGNLVEVDRTSSDVAIIGFDVRGNATAPEDYLNWSAEQWLVDWRANGIRVDGDDSVVRDSVVTAVTFGITTTGARAEVRDNRVDGFSGDGLRGLGNGSVFAGNHVQNAVSVDDNHDDGFQTWATHEDPDGRKSVSDILVENNTILEWVGPADHPLRSKLQGISLFDGIYRNIVIRNNLVAVDAFHGISVYAGTDSLIANNTVVNISGTPADHPWILLRDNRNGWKSGNVEVRNNVAMAFQGVANWQESNLGIRVPSVFFAAPLDRDFRPKPGGPLIGAGSQDAAVPTDLQGTPRADPPTLGAFEAGAR
ncbi:right-handed parallel beta-helix repeat-containing protein [Dinoroseobacter sp. S375]|uniref:right-handed parallel beta-helix repeat-containing protein n=1 Tax=Dinoroseobacter sp. S375 TaxID=3415136 RepID=UPI003C7BDB9E